MDNLYLILVIVLFILAFSDLIVGVSNDAVNFLNSAIGSKVAPRYVIMILASLGILIGATFSSGMMEVARKGIFFPEHFYFSEIMIIFLAVMIADVILLDLFNTFGLPTSTTVSIVFELLGGAVAVSIIKIYNVGGTLSTYINTGTALVIISGILLSIVIAFTVGTIVQYLSRLIFTFNYKKNIHFFGALWGSINITAITYFMLIKGAKGSSFISAEALEYIKTNTFFILVVCFIFWAILLQLIIWFTKVNILRIIVLVGTFALAMAFAGNDLVNFIGVPLAGFSAYKDFVANSDVDATQFLMTSLSGKVHTDTYLLIIAGLVMSVTLWVSRKARSVTETTLNLSRQVDGDERFGSSPFSRNIVRGSLSMMNSVNRFIPKFISTFAEKRFAIVNESTDKKDAKKSFDLIRASVNLSVASVLIAFATSLKLPLSTTYVTFMVAMGTSFGDGAWGRESAVYRISGVTSVIGGWFLTAFAAFVAAFTFAYIIYLGGFIVIAALILIAIIFIVKTHSVHKRNETKKQNEAESDRELLHSDVMQKSAQNIIQTLETISRAYYETLEGLADEDRKRVKMAKKEVEGLNKVVKKLKNKLYNTINNLREDSIETGHYYVQVLDYLREMAHCLTYISEPVYEHIDNTHKGMSEEQIAEFRKLSDGVGSMIGKILKRIQNQTFDDIKPVIEEQQLLLAYLVELNKIQLKRIKHGQASTKNGILYLGILSETKNLLLHTVNLLKAERDFIMFKKID